MPKFSLKRDEYVVMKSEGVRHGGVMAVYTDQLVLTNQNVILISKGILGNTKKIEYFPLASIKNIDDKPQAIASGDKLEVYFVDRYESFELQSKKEVKAWADNVSNLLTGRPDAVRSGQDKAIPGAAYVAETLRDTLDTVKRSLRLKSENSDVERVARACTSCGASISGVAGRVVRCEFCNSDQQL